MNSANNQEYTTDKLPSSSSLHQLANAFVVFLLLILILYPMEAYEGASHGLLLWFHHVLPNLLPFIIISNIIIRLQLACKISRLFYPLFGKLFRISCDACYPLILGFLSGIPMGAKSTADLVSKKFISLKEGNFILTMCNNLSPMFLMGYIAISQLKLPQIKYVLFVIIYGSSIISALLYRFLCQIHSKETSTARPAITASPNQEPNQKLQRSGDAGTYSYEVLDSSIMNGFEVITRIGGYMIIFSILAQAVNAFWPSDMGCIKAFIMGILEITTGIDQICNTQLDQAAKIVLVLVLSSFGGLSSMAQTKSVLGNTRLSMKSYVIVKLISASVTLLLALTYVTMFL